MLSKKNLKNYGGQIIKVNLTEDSGYVAGVLTVTEVYSKQYVYSIASTVKKEGRPKWTIILSLSAIKGFEVLNFDALEKSQKRLEKANGRKLNGNGKIKKVLQSARSGRSKL